MKKICCSLLLLLFTFVCLFATIPKNKVSADTLVPSSYNYAINYFAPRITSYNFNNNLVVLNNELISGLYGSGASYNTYNSRVVFNEEGAPMYSVEYDGIFTQYNSLTNNYWLSLDGTNDFTFIDRYNFATLLSGDDLILTFTFDTHYFDLEFLKSTNEFYGIQLPFVSDNYVVEYTYNINAFDEQFEYTKNDIEWTGNNLRYRSFNNTISLLFATANFTYIDFMSFSDISNYIYNDLYNISEFRSVSVDGVVRIYIEDWESLLLDSPNFTYLRKVHPYSSYQEYPEKGGSVLPGMYLGQNMSFLPGGLPNDGGNNEDGFIEDISTSLLNGVQNFLTFEISPGFSLYHILLLVVAIPLLILILKLFLGG